MMLSVKINENGDIELDASGNPIQIAGPEETRQEVEVYMQTNKREWFLDPELGMEHSEFRGKNVVDDLIRINIIDALEQTDRFVSLDSIEVSRNRVKRKLDVSFIATMTEGIIDEVVAIDAE